MRRGLSSREAKGLRVIDCERRALAVRWDRLGVSPIGVGAKPASGEIHNEGHAGRQGRGLTKIVLPLGTEVTACAEMISEAVWVRDLGCGRRVGSSRSPMPARSRRS